MQLRDVAARVGLSTAAISLALRDSARVSPKKRRLVQRVARQMGYIRQPRQPHGRHDCTRVAFLHVETPTRACDLAGIPRSVAAVFTRHGPALNVTVASASIPYDLNQTGCRQFLQDFLADRQGVLLLGMVREPLVRFIQERDLPLVVLGETDITLDQATTMKLQRVNCDALGMALCATRFLLQRGCRRLAFVGGLRDPGFYYDQWYDGFLLAHARAGLKHDPNLALFHDLDNPMERRIDPLLQGRPDGFVWPDQSFTGHIQRMLRDRGFESSALPQVLGGSVGEIDEPFAALPQVLSDQGLMALQGLKHLQSLHHHRAQVALTMHVPFLLQGIDPCAPSRAHALSQEMPT